MRSSKDIDMCLGMHYKFYSFILLFLLYISYPFSFSFSLDDLIKKNHNIKKDKFKSRNIKLSTNDDIKKNGNKSTLSNRNSSNIPTRPSSSSTSTTLSHNKKENKNIQDKNNQKNKKNNANNSEKIVKNAKIIKRGNISNATDKLMKKLNNYEICITNEKVVQSHAHANNYHPSLSNENPSHALPFSSIAIGSGSKGKIPEKIMEKTTIVNNDRNRNNYEKRSNFNGNRNDDMNDDRFHFSPNSFAFPHSSFHSPSFSPFHPSSLSPSSMSSSLFSSSRRIKDERKENRNRNHESLPSFNKGNRNGSINNNGNRFTLHSQEIKY